MAQHLAHELARQGLTVPGNLIQPIGDLVAELTPDAETPTPAVDAWLLQAAVEQAPTDSFGDLAAAPGLLDRLARAIQEFQAARCDSGRLASFARNRYQRAFVEVYRLYERFLRAHGLVSPAERLSLAAQNAAVEGLPGVRDIGFDGFYQLSVGEKDLIESLAASVDEIRIALGDEPPQSWLMRFPIESHHKVRREKPETEIVVAAGLEAEIEEVARRILASRKPYREIGVILRRPDEYASTLQAVFERYGIPFRLRRRRKLAEHDAVACLRELLRAAADGFPGDATLAALRRPACRIGLDPWADSYDFKLRDRLPGEGLDFLGLNAPGTVAKFLEDLAPLDAWRKQRHRPAEWARRTRDARATLLATPRPPDPPEIARILEIRAWGQAVQAFDAATDEAARLLELQSRPECGFAAWLDALDAVLTRTPLRVADTRRDVVNVLSVFEARQWELAEVFVCGLVEGRFPARPAEDPFFPEADRRKMQQAGVPILTRSDRQAEEEALYQIASTRATDRLTLTYPELDEAGAPLLRSFFLPPAGETGDRPARRVKPRETAPAYPDPLPAEIIDPELQRLLRDRFAHFSPSRLEKYLQCPYQFFASSTLRLKEAPGTVEQRLDPLAKGTILHAAVADWSQDPAQPVGPILRSRFDEKLAELHLRPGFRSAMVLANLEGDLERFVSEPLAAGLPGAVESGHETEVEYVIEDDDAGAFQVFGRIDRFETLDGDYAVVIDYKHSAANRIKTLVKEHADGRRVQGPLYLLGLREREGRKLKPGAMLFWGLRGETSIGGWVAEGMPAEADLPGGVELLSDAELDDRLRAAARVAAGAVSEIRAGRIAVDPRDRDFCRRFCDYRAVCRLND